MPRATQQVCSFGRLTSNARCTHESNSPSFDGEKSSTVSSAMATALKEEGSCAGAVKVRSGLRPSRYALRCVSCRRIVSGWLSMRWGSCKAPHAVCSSASLVQLGCARALNMRALLPPGACSERKK